MFQNSKFSKMPYIFPDEDLQVIVRKALNEDVNTRDRDLETIKTWMKQQPHLPDTWDELGLMNFLRGCNFSLERAKKKIDMYFTMRAAVPEFFVDRDPGREEFEVVFKVGNMSYLPGLTPEGLRVCIAGAACETDYYNFTSLCKIVTMVGDIRLVTEKYGVSGDIYILDAKVTLLKNFLQISPALFKKFFICIQEAYPVKIKQVHIINSHPFVGIIFNALKPLLKEKLRSRVHIHESLETLYDYVPKEMLPEEYGGCAGKILDLRGMWVEKMREFVPWFKEQEGVVADARKRVGDVMNYDDLFGVEGSFRQLTID